MTFRFSYLILFFVVLFSVCFLCCNRTEAFENESVDSIDYYVITMRPEERIKNINLQHSKMRKNAENIKLEYVDAVVGKDLNIEKMKKTGELVLRKPDSFSKSIKNELGCYLSHMKAYDTILKKRKPGFSVVFEDDFNLEDGFMAKLEKTIDVLKTVDFDFCFLGMLNGAGGEHFKGDVYRIPKEGDLWQTHAYLVKNENIEKIMKGLMPITDLIDVAIFNKGKMGEFNVYTVQPTIVTQGGFGTSIRTE